MNPSSQVRRHRFTAWWLSLAPSLMFACIANVGVSQTIGPPTSHSGALEASASSTMGSRPDVFSLDRAPEQARSLLTEVARATIPDEHEDTRKWGKKKKVWDGLHMRMDGLELKTKRRWKEVNHGTWKQYRVTLVDPDENLTSEISHLREVGPGQIVFQLSLSAKAHAYAQLQEWRRGLKLLSISAEAIADVKLDVAFEMTTELDASKFPPDLVLKPVATAADLRLIQFKLQRVSKADGPIIRELGDGLEDILRNQLAARREKLVEKINKAITKKPDALRLSIHDLVKNQWLDSSENTASPDGVVPSPAGSRTQQ